ncbi:MAG: hypothetical protein HY319_15365 [Armatimonadetes bacterium]|nr:hypothetical protein [Armatimonadota bacterium]
MTIPGKVQNIITRYHSSGNLGERAEKTELQPQETLREGIVASFYRRFLDEVDNQTGLDRDPTAGKILADPAVLNEVLEGPKLPPGGEFRATLEGSEENGQMTLTEEVPGNPNRYGFVKFQEKGIETLEINFSSEDDYVAVAQHLPYEGAGSAETLVPWNLAP